MDATQHLSIKEITLAQRLHRFYPPFRSGAANFQPMPFIKETEIPFAVSPAPYLRVDLKRMAAIPVLGVDSKGNTGVVTTIGPEWTERPNPFPMDSLRIDIEKTHDGTPEWPNLVALRLMEQLRWLTQQWWINRSTAGLQGFIRNSFAIDRQGLPLAEPDGLAGGRTVAGFERSVTSQIWSEAIRRLELGQVPPEYDLLILDGHYFLSIDDYRRAVLDSVTGCEQARDAAVERVYRSRVGAGFRKGRVIKSESLPVSLDKDLKRFIGRSYRDEFPTEYERLDALWDSRGRVAHGGPATVRLGGGLVPLTEEHTAPLVDAARRCLSWLAGLN